jgi:hypothetical protein
MRSLICLGLILLLAGCLPIGIRGQTLYAWAADVAPVRTG